MKVRTFGLDWRISLALECLFYFRTCANWQDVIRARLRSVPLERFITRSGMVICFGGSVPWQIFKEIWRSKVYTRAYPKHWHAPRVIVDIGANVGFFSIFAADRWPSSKIYAYEPATENYSCLRRNVEDSHLVQIVVRPEAFAGAVGQASFYLKKESGWHSLNSEGALSTVQVSTTTLEAIIQELAPAPIDFLKIDCEGAEYDALAGCSELLSGHVRFIAMEYHETAENRVTALFEIFERAGMRCWHRPEPRWRTGMLYAVNDMLN